LIRRIRIRWLECIDEEFGRMKHLIGVAVNPIHKLISFDWFNICFVSNGKSSLELSSLGDATTFIDDM